MILKIEISAITPEGMFEALSLGARCAQGASKVTLLASEIRWVMFGAGGGIPIASCTHRRQFGCLGMVRLAFEIGGLVGATMAHADAHLDIHGWWTLERE